MSVSVVRRSFTRAFIAAAAFSASLVPSLLRADTPAAIPVAPSVPPAPVMIAPLGTPIAVTISRVSIDGPNGPMGVWLYIPAHPDGIKVPLVLVSPGGSRLFTGMTLSTADEAEQMPYARAGFVVAAFDIDGALPAAPAADDMADALIRFRRADGGVTNARLALDFALNNVPGIDRNRIYIAGDSSAATLALQVAEADTRIKACVAFAPVGDLIDNLGWDRVSNLDGLVPGFSKFLVNISPHAHVNKLHCPVFIFHADDDTVVPSSEVSSFVALLAKNNVDVTYDRVPSGSHYDTMVGQGIPQAISWLVDLPR